MTVRKENKSFLDGVVVLDLADEKGSFCSRLLADLGATVIKVEKPHGDSSRSIGPFYTHHPNRRSFSLSFLYNNLNKRSITLDIRTDEGKRLFERLVKKADVLIETFAPEDREKFNLDPSDPNSVNPHLVHLSITAFGRNGPKQSHQISDSTSAASGGQMFVCRDGSGKPVNLYGAQPYYTASLFGSVAVLLHLKKAAATGIGSSIDLSIQEAVAPTLDHVMVDYFSTGSIYKQPNPYSSDRNFTLLPCRDGHVLISIQHNWETLIEILASENMVDVLMEKEWDRQTFREVHFDHIIEVMKKWTKTHSKQELFELGQAMRFPWAPVALPEEVIKSPQLQFRRFFIDIDQSAGNPRIKLPGSPYKFSSCSMPVFKTPPSAGEHSYQVIEEFVSGKKNNTLNCQKFSGGSAGSNRNFLQGIRVLDLTRMLSGPYCTRILADSGAEVIKVQTGKTALGAEQNDSAFFSTWNRNKRSITLDLSAPDARNCLTKLAAVSDIVVENYAPRVMENWELTYDQLKKVNPSLIMLSISAMGQTGPWKDYVGFGPTFHALSGLTAASSAGSDFPVVIGHAYGDIIIGLYAALAILAALEFRNRTGKGQYIDLSGYEALCTVLGPALMHFDISSDEDFANRSIRGNSVTGSDYCFPCRGKERWCAVTLNNDKEWQLFCNLLNVSDLNSERFSTTARRNDHREELESLIAQRTADYTTGSIIEILQKAGIAASVVQNAEDLAKDPQLSVRNFFISLEYSAAGSIISDRSALWPDQRPEAWRAAPRLGEDNYDVFVRLLGMPEATYRSFINRSIIR